MMNIDSRQASAMKMLWFALAVCCYAAAAIADDKPDFSLANVYSSGQYEVADYWASEKYDGVRALWDGRQLISRGGKTFAAPKWFVAGLPQAELDGELWLGRGRFEETSGIVRRQKAHEGWRDIRYVVFDLPKHGGTFRHRYAKLRAHFAESKNAYWRVAEQRQITSADALENYFAEVVGGGGEGVMLRRIESKHRAGRSDDLLKYKPFMDAEAIVIGYNPGKGKYTGMTGSLRVQMLGSDKTFSVGSGLSDNERQNPPPMGATITYKHQGLTKYGIPRFPVFLRIRADEPQK